MTQKRALEAQLLNLKPAGTKTRTVLFGEVRADTNKQERT